MSGFEIFLIGVALSMDAFAVSVTNGIDEPEMSAGKWFSVAFVFALFQFGMPAGRRFLPPSGVSRPGFRLRFSDSSAARRLWIT